MKNSLVKLCLVAITAISLHAEADFDTVQNLIGSGKYQQALDSLKVIAKNHPNSAKVQYTLAQAQAGIGNLPAAAAALDKAKAIDPDLKFVSKSQVQELSEVINAVRVIKKVENSSHWFLWFVAVSSCLGAVWYFFFRGKKETEKEPVKTETQQTTNYSYRREEPAKTERPERSSFGDYCYNRTSVPEHRETVREVREVHHYHDNSNSGMSTLGTVAVAAGSAAVVSSMMNSHGNYSNHGNSGSSYSSNNTVNNYNYQTVNERETSNVSDSWEEQETISKSWDSPSDSSSSDSWDSGSDDSSSSWEA